ncbi:MAG: 50S ribosome-binding GTPase, partial [Oscillospiraceae bacterium]|nr:50S ribosome-binding GTPase [Oscillospiraceae bacterium]
MSMNLTPSGERVHIAFFGCRNAGKSSLLNAVTGQNLAIVSDVKGTTTDPVYKALELLPAGPVVVIDTPGLDDVGELGQQRIASALRVLRKTDIAVLVVDGVIG